MSGPKAQTGVGSTPLMESRDEPGGEGVCITCKTVWWCHSPSDTLNKDILVFWRTLVDSGGQVEAVVVCYQCQHRGYCRPRALAAAKKETPGGEGRNTQEGNHSTSWFWKCKTSQRIQYSTIWRSCCQIRQFLEEVGCVLFQTMNACIQRISVTNKSFSCMLRTTSFPEFRRNCSMV